MKRLLSALVAGLLAAACNASSQPSSVNTTTTTTTTPTATVTTETFTGQVEVSGRMIHPFTILLSGGQVNVTLTQAGPPATIYMGLGVGAYATDGSCTLFTNGYLVTQASSTAQLAGTLNAGSYCVMVYDVGNQTAAITYQVIVNHY